MVSKREQRSAQRRRQRKLKSLALILSGSGLLLIFATNQIKQYLPVTEALIEVFGVPSLKVDREFVDLGEIKFDNPVAVSFQVTNVGDKPLKFKESPYVEVMEGC